MVMKLGKGAANLLDNKAKDGSEQGADGAALTATPVVKKRKADELLSSVVGESTVGSAIGLMRKNAAFILPDEKSWVVLGLQVSDIGGLSMKQKNDEAKGSLIQLITADQITTVTTADMLSAEVLGIIPNEESLSRMDEFGLLRNAPYLWIVVRQKSDGSLDAGPVSDAGLRASFEDVVAVSSGELSLASLLPDVWTAAGGSDEDLTTTAVSEVSADEPEPEAVSSSRSDEPLAAPADGFVDDDSPFGDEPVDYDALDSADDELPIEDALADEAEDADDAEDEDEADANDDDDADFGDPEPAAESETVEEAVASAPATPVDDRIVNEAEVQDSIARRFLTSDLDLEVDLGQFESNFIVRTNPIAFDFGVTLTETGTDSDWLSQQVKQLSLQANVQLEQLHDNHKASLREYYVSLMSAHIEQVITDVSLDNEGSYYYRLSRAAKADFTQRQRQSPEEVSALRRELNERYDGEADARAAQAAEAARLRYKEQNRARHERDLAEIALENERASESMFAGARQVILETRRKDALSRIDLGATKIFDVLVERQVENRAAEETMLKEWSDRMALLIDENRKSDLARSEALAEQLSRINQVEELKAEHSARVAELRQEQVARVSDMSADLERAREEAFAELTTQSTAWNNSLAEERQKTDAAQGQIKTLLAEFDQLGPTLESHYKNQIESARVEADSYSLALERSGKVQSRANKTMVGLIVVLALASLAVGFIAGFIVVGQFGVTLGDVFAPGVSEQTSESTPLGDVAELPGQ